MQTLGETIREIRTTKNLLLRQVAAGLSIDPSLLSRMERGEKRITRAQIIQLAAFLHTDLEPLLILYLSERVLYELRDEQLALRAITVAEKRIAYLTIKPDNHE